MTFIQKSDSQRPNDLRFQSIRNRVYHLNVKTNKGEATKKVLVQR